MRLFLHQLRAEQKLFWRSRELAFFTNWSFAHPPAIELAERIAQLAPSGLERVFFTSGGSEAVESAWKLARAFHRVRGEPDRTKIVARELAYHGTTMGALAATGITPLRAPFEPFTPGGCHVPNTNQYRLKPGFGPEMLADAVAERIEFEGPETVAAVILEPVQNAGGCFTPPPGYFQRLREICDRHGVLLVAGVTFLVTRQVVTPVRMARRVAERLAGWLREAAAD